MMMELVRKVLSVFGLVPADVKYAVRSFVFAFLGLFLPILLGWLNDWTQWAPGKPVPDLHALGAAAVSAVAGACVAVVTLVVRAIEGKSGKALLRPNPPKVRRR